MQSLGHELCRPCVALSRRYKDCLDPWSFTTHMHEGGYHALREMQLVATRSGDCIPDAHTHIYIYCIEIDVDIHIES